MGQARVNVELGVDRPEGCLEAIAQLRRHREPPPRDERSDDASGADHLRLRDAASEGQRAFYVVASEVLGDGWRHHAEHHEAWLSLYQRRGSPRTWCS